MEGKIKVTVGVCVKNEEKNIQRTIESIVGQDFPHELMEVIFVDDGSEDRTLSILLDLVSKMPMHVKVYHGRWRGIGAARNVVVRNAQGDYIVWIDGGMIVARNFIKKLLEFIEQNPKIGIVKAAHRVAYDRRIVSWLEKMSNLVGDMRHGGRATPIPTGSGGAIYRAKAIREIGGFDDYIQESGEDLDVELKMRDAGWLIFKTNTTFFHKIPHESWKSLWYEGIRYGRGGHYLVHKHGKKVFKQSLTSFFDVLMNLCDTYKLTRSKAAFLLPFYYLFKKLAWSFGFVKAHLDGYKWNKYPQTTTTKFKYNMIYSK